MACLVKLRWVGEEPIKCRHNPVRWLYQHDDIKVDQDEAEILLKKYGKENFLVLRDPHALLGEKIKGTVADGPRRTELVKKSRKERREEKKAEQA